LALPQNPPQQPKVAKAEDHHVKEVIAICIDVSGSMKAPFESERTRLEAVKQMFYGFRDRTTVLDNGHQHRLGLISFDNRVYVHSQPTDEFAVFEEVIDDLETKGSTAIFEAIHAACEMLTPWKENYPKADLRVMCLSDGQNNCHRVKAEDALQACFNLGATCDCLLVGNQADAELLRLVQATEGMCFQITGLADGYECLESQAVVSLEARRNGSPKPAFVKRTVEPDYFRSGKKAVIHRGAVRAPAATTQKRKAVSLKAAMKVCLHAYSCMREC
jgi:hypothetical protein